MPVPAQAYTVSFALLYTPILKERIYRTYKIDSLSPDAEFRKSVEKFLVKSQACVQKTLDVNIPDVKQLPWKIASEIISRYKLAQEQITRYLRGDIGPEDVQVVSLLSLYNKVPVEDES